MASKSNKNYIDTTKPLPYPVTRKSSKKPKSGYFGGLLGGAMRDLRQGMTRNLTPGSREKRKEKANY